MIMLSCMCHGWKYFLFIKIQNTCLDEIIPREVLIFVSLTKFDSAIRDIWRAFFQQLTFTTHIKLKPKLTFLIPLSLFPTAIECSVDIMNC